MRVHSRLRSHGGAVAVSFFAANSIGRAEPCPDLRPDTNTRSWTCHATSPDQLTDIQKQWLREHPDAIKAYLRTFVKMMMLL